MNVIAAVDENWAIGNRNELLVRIPADHKFFREETTDTPGMVPLLLPELEVQDIDTEEDWAIAEVKYQKMMEKE